MAKVSELKGPIRQALLVKVKAEYPNAYIDQWLHIKWTAKGRTYRLKFQATTVRREVRTDLGEWVRLDTLRLTTLAEKLL